MPSDYFRIIIVTWKTPKTLIVCPLLLLPSQTSLLINSLNKSPYYSPLAHTSLATLGCWCPWTWQPSSWLRVFCPWYCITLEHSSPITCITCSPTTLNLPQMSLSQWVLPSKAYLKWNTYPSTPRTHFCFCFSPQHISPSNKVCVLFI